MDLVSSLTVTWKWYKSNGPFTHPFKCSLAIHFGYYSLSQQCGGNYQPQIQFGSPPSIWSSRVDRFIRHLKWELCVRKRLHRFHLLCNLLRIETFLSTNIAVEDFSYRNNIHYWWTATGWLIRDKGAKCIDHKIAIFVAILFLSAT